MVIVTARLKYGRVGASGRFGKPSEGDGSISQRSIPERLKRSIVSACCDTYEGYTEAIREELPHVRLVIDRFHVARAYRDGLDSLRKAELKRLKRALSTQEYKALKGSMWALRKKKQDLTLEERRTLRRLFRLSPDLQAAYSLQNRLTAIFEEQLSPPAAKTKIKRWIVAVAQSGVRCFDWFINTLARWWIEILNYFVERETSGFVEGFNNKIKVLKRRSYGMTNRKTSSSAFILTWKATGFLHDHHMWLFHGHFK